MEHDLANLPRNSDRFKFQLGQGVTIKSSGEKGEVRGRAEYEHGENLYYVEYVDGTGSMRERWVGESQLTFA